MTLAFSLITLVWVIVMATQYNTSGPTFQFTEEYSWIPQFGVHYALGVDGIALVLIGMTVILMPVVVLASWHDADEAKRSPKVYFALMLVLETMMIGVFAATDVFLFYVFFEAMLIPMYFMIGSFGVGARQYAAVKFLLYSLLGGLLMLVAVIALYVYSGQSRTGSTGRSCSTRWRTWRCPRPCRSGCSSGSSSRSRSRRRCGRSTPGCPTPPRPPSPARRC